MFIGGCWPRRSGGSAITKSIFAHDDKNLSPLHSLQSFPTVNGKLWFFCVNKTTGWWSCASVFCILVLCWSIAVNVSQFHYFANVPDRHHWAPMSPGHWSVYTMCCLLSALVCLWLPVPRAPARAHWADTAPASAATPGIVRGSLNYPLYSSLYLIKSAVLELVWRSP